MSDNEQSTAELAASKAQLKQLRLSQRGHRGSETRFVDEGKQIIASGDTQEASVGRLKQLSANIAQTIQDLQAIYANIMDLVDEEEMEKRSRKRTTLQNALE